MAELGILDRLVPVVVVNDPKATIMLAELLLKKGIRTIEITNRRPNSLDCAKGLIRAELGITVGVGTILNSKDARLAEEIGANYLVSPGQTDELRNSAKKSSVTHYLGFSTISEAMTLWSEGLSAGKFFPAKVSGGTGLLTALNSVLPSFRTFPTGGISPADLAEYFSQPNVQLVGGTWLASESQISEGDWKEISQQIDATIQLIEQIERKP